MFHRTIAATDGLSSTPQICHLPGEMLGASRCLGLVFPDTEVDSKDQTGKAGASTIILAVDPGLVCDVDHDAGDVVTWVGQDEDPEGALAAHANREAGDMLEAAREPHLPQRGLGAD
jgi:hypothetical protein